MEGRYRAYPKYKDSGIEWLGEVPERWQICRIKFFSELNPSKSQIKEMYPDTEVTFLPMEAIGESGSLDRTRVKLLKDVQSGYTYIGEGDVCIAKITPCFENGKGAVANDLKNGIAFATTEVIPARCHRLEDSQYLYYLLTSAPFNKVAEGSMYGAGGQKRVSDNFVANYHFSLPTYPERQHIANFLDHETARIDTLIEKQQQLITLLQEKRQAVISHAVTKGLNPDAPMKDSGVEWLGEVPEHWTVKNYRYATQIYRGKFGHRPRNDPSLYEGKYPFIQTGDIARADKKILSYNQTLNEKGKNISQKFPTGTLVMAIAANIGDTAILDFEAYAPDSVVGFKPKQDVLLEFLRYSLIAALPALEQTSTQNTQANLNIDRISAIKAVFPPLREQSKIVEMLDNLIQCSRIVERKSLIAITLLQERRTALISAAVTGKIDVRDWKPTSAPSSTLEPLQ